MAILTPYKLLRTGLAFTGGGAPAPSTVFLNNFNGIDGATTTANVTPTGSMTCDTAAELDTAVKKFGTASVKMTGTDTFATDCAFGNATPFVNGSVFTIEGWIYMATSLGALGAVSTFDINGSANSVVSITFNQNGNAFALDMVNDAGINCFPQSSQGPGTFDVDTWYHFAFTVDGSGGAGNGLVKYFFNGNRMAQFTGLTIGTIVADYIQTHKGNSTDGDVWIDDLKVSTSIRYLNNTYTIPTAEFTVD